MTFSFQLARLARTHQTNINKPTTAGPIKANIRTLGLTDSTMRGSMRIAIIEATHAAAGHHLRGTKQELAAFALAVVSKLDIDLGHKIRD